MGCAIIIRSKVKTNHDKRIKKKFKPCEEIKLQSIHEFFKP